MASKKAKKLAKAKRREAVKTSDRVGPTPETLAKLIPCPIAEMYRLGLIDTATKDAALELAEIYVAVYGAQLPGARGAGGHPHLSDVMAWKHEYRYLPWSRKWTGMRWANNQGISVCRPTSAKVIDLVVTGRPMRFDEIIAALKDYAEICKRTPMPKAEDLAILCA